MGLMARIGQLVRANAAAAIAQAEDPEQVLDQTLLEMQEDLTRLRQAVAQAIATQKRTERQREAANVTAKDWYRRAQQALDAGDEAQARTALARRQPYQDTADRLTEQWQSQRTAVNQLRTNLRELEERLLETRAKRDLYVARARSAIATQRMQETLGTLDRPQNALERMESRVLELEAQAGLVGDRLDPVEQSFNSLESQQRIDRALEQLKAQTDA
ncbi:MAG: PspA/IM30 family protein [Oscillatoriales cyanobacterium]|nr:MAG: PspA/IM30 family protein [Oscillatoriales cyanobacterium]